MQADQIIRRPAEWLYKTELDQLKKLDKGNKPANWLLSPAMVVNYIMGGKVGKVVIEPKYIGQRRLIEIAVATLATDRALLLSGVPGTAKTWVSEHLSAAISNDSSLLLQGTAGLMEESMRYGWNYAVLIAKGPVPEALVKSPVMKGMEEGRMVRIEEISRISADVQDALITVISEKILPIPELNQLVSAQKGFNIIATANDRDKGINEMSAALKRRFNTVTLPLPSSLEEEIEIVKFRVDKSTQSLELPTPVQSADKIRQLVTIFRELREGVTADGQMKLKSPGSLLSTAEAISVMINAQSMAVHFNNGEIGDSELAASMSGVILRDREHSLTAWREYLEKILRKRKEWKGLYQACAEMTDYYEK
jgi:MoxR-like ATPase